MTASGRELAATNGCFGDVEPIRSRTERWAGSERPEGPLRVGLRQPNLRIHRQKADIESSIPVSRRSPTRRFDPKRKLAYANELPESGRVTFELGLAGRGDMWFIDSDREAKGECCQEISGKRTRHPKSCPS